VDGSARVERLRTMLAAPDPTVSFVVEHDENLTAIVHGGAGAIGSAVAEASGGIDVRFKPSRTTMSKARLSSKCDTTTFSGR
jgi:hypothetical protein